MRWNGWAVVLVCALACVLPHWSCKGRSIAVMPVSETKLDELSPTTRPAFAAGREALLGGRAADAQAIFAQLHQDDPRHMMYALWMQDAQREAARLAGRLSDPQGWWFEARQRNDVRAWLLAARAALDDATEWEALTKAATVPDPPPEDAVWLHYALGARAARLGAYEEAKAEASKARALDAGHSHAYWLEAWIAARHGSQAQGAAMLRGWLERARDDIRMDPARVAAAELDLALLSLAADDVPEARKWLAQVDPWLVDLARLETARAAASEAGGDAEAAVRSARAAATAAPEDLLPLVQQAILLEGPLADPAAAEALWLRVYESQENSGQLLDLLRATRARIRYERLVAARGGQPAQGQ